MNLQGELLPVKIEKRIEMNFLDKFFKRLKPSENKYYFIAAVALAFVLGLIFGGGSDNTGHEQMSDNHNHEKAEVWTCSMHPQVRLKEPGLCPICNMELIPLEDSGGEQDGGAVSLKLSERARALAGVEVAEVKRGVVDHEIELSGTIEYDRNRIRTISARFSGRIENLFVSYPGENIKKGTPLFKIYSPDLIAAQKELLEAARLAEKTSSEGKSVSYIRENLEAARRKLKLWGYSDKKVDTLVENGKIEDYLTVYSPFNGVVVEQLSEEGEYVKEGAAVYRVADLSVIWIRLEAYETDLPFLGKGMRTEFTVPNYPGEVFSGKIFNIEPVLNKRTRTVPVLLSSGNNSGKLKPGLLVSAVVRVPTKKANSNPLLIPASAPLITGKRAVVYIEKPSSDGTFEAREVKLGKKFGNYYEVLSGLEEGEKVVTKGNFKIDSELQIQAKPSMMNPEGGSSPITHDHSAHNNMKQEKSHESSGSHEQMKDESRGEQAMNHDVEMDELLAYYFNIQASLSSDDFKGAASEASKLQETAAKIKAHAPDFKEWIRSTGNAAGELSKSVDIKAARHHFYMLSELMIKGVEKWGASGKKPVVLMFCPMARDNRGAYWLQDNEDLKNPFYGAQMLRCGEKKKVLIAVESSEGGRDK